MYAYLMRELPDPNKLLERNIPQTTKIYDRTGETILYEIHGDQKRTLVELDHISKHVIGATVSAEDRQFYEHNGFNIRGILRSVYINLRRMVTPGGSKTLVSGSTITQQLVKLSILSSEQTAIRKIREIMLSIMLEQSFTKDEIIKLYLNEIPYGSLSYGIESAAQTFFGKSANDLTVDEAALLAVLPRATTFYSPYGSHRDALVDRQHAVIDLMAADGYITAEEAETAKNADVLSKIKERSEGIKAPHFVFYVRERLAETFGEQLVEEGGLKVITTLDARKQELAEGAIDDQSDYLLEGGATSAALLSLDPKNGDVLAMVGSADYFNDDINGKFNALTGHLQPGSSIKPMVYAAGFEKGYTPETVLYDVTTEFASSGKSYRPQDYDGGERGPVTVRQALANSLNIPAVKMLYLVGIPDFYRFLSDELGYELPPLSTLGLSMTLGGVQVQPIQHITAYAAFASDGNLPTLRSILRVEDPSGHVLYEATQPEVRRVYSERTARQINSILSDNEARAQTFGLNSYLHIPGRQVAAKTGTTNNYKDAWAIGYTPSIVTGVWVGDSVRGASMDPGLGGSRMAGPIWNKYMRAALENLPAEEFMAPEPELDGEGNPIILKPVLSGDKSGRITVKVDKFTGLLATEFTPPELIEEREYGSLHSILHFVTKDNPRGPNPEQPENDPQYANWEAAVADWADRSGIKVEENMPPEAFDDLHTPENRPIINFVWPSEGVTMTSRAPTVTVSASAPRGVAKVEYYFDDALVGVSTMHPFTATLSIPNRFLKGFHFLRAVAFDDVGNRGEQVINVNLTAPAGELGLIWENLYDLQRIGYGNLPFLIRLGVQDYRSVRVMTVKVTDQGGQEQVLGTIREPSLPNLSFSWSPTQRGLYRITVEADLTTGDRRSSSLNAQIE